MDRTIEELKTRLLMLEGRVQVQQSEIARLTGELARADGEFAHKTHYPGPFHPHLESGDTEIHVGQGYVFAGDLAEYDWPQAGDTDYVSVGGLSLTDNDYILFMTVVVDPDYGCFTASYKPYLGVEAASEHHVLNTYDGTNYIIAKFRVYGGKITQLLPWRGIYLPVHKVFSSYDEPPVPTYYCRLTNVFDEYPVAEPADPDASAVEKCHPGE